MKYRTKAPVFVEAMQFDGKNGAEIRSWIESARKFAGDEDETHWWLTKGMTTSTSNQAWNYAKAGQKWSDKTKAAVYNALHDNWLPVVDGDFIVMGAANDFYTVNKDSFLSKYTEDKA